MLSPDVRLADPGIACGLPHDPFTSSMTVAWGKPRLRSAQAAAAQSPGAEQDTAAR